MALHWLVHVFLWCLSLATISSSSSASSSSMKCQRRCGKIKIPFPFGMGDPNCFRNKWFNVTCDESVTPPKALLGHNRLVKQDLEVLDISLEGHLKTKKKIIHDCRSKSYNDTDVIGTPISFYESPYSFSNTRNKFTAVGCNTLAYMTGFTRTSSQIFRVGCISNCFGAASVIINGSYSCTGIACCQTPIPPGIVGFQVDISRVSAWWNSCSYAYLVDQDYDLKFTVLNLSITITSFLDRNKRVPVVLDWVASQNETCEEATDYACLSENSICYNSTNGPGYSCKCSPGYQGNPYIHGGCMDIDECKNKTSHNCNQMCINMPGSHHCKCRKGYHGDGWNNGTRCTADAKEFPVLKVILGTGLSFLFLLIASTWIYWLWRKRRSMKLKEKFFQQNGGLVLQQKINTRRSDTFKIFTIEELERATNNYAASTIVGQGGFEDQVPILVYEFISNGTLYHHIHEAGHLPSISLENRLRIATEIAEALAYLHFAASMPIFHRDIKSANILLDNNFTVKVADFGVSRLVPVDHTQITTLVQGTWGYLDPECFQTGKLTDRSDVYSFGVVLLELLTGEKAVCLNRSYEDRNLAMYFVREMKENRLFQMLEERVRSEASVEQLMAIAQLSLRCLKLNGEKRPIMKEVVVDLQGLRGFQKHHSVHDQEIEKLLCETSQGCKEDAGGQYSVSGNFDISLTLNR
ncbi:putative wall-associated receptor kinase-like protein 16 [Cinnamomum micranthum f. kanehirae]|uniref:Putative wall-associated receptor kinase-like protein 16 n=1 Tax=Cinnamomum micranthum f. kanehirae TaxID=337451 RepID=A0A443N7T5_9MAGN|nr:putative wall-associated receptor kinase-like protein 16 [Cinnamomum micranthum f. kanehirae]